MAEFFFIEAGIGLVPVRYLDVFNFEHLEGLKMPFINFAAVGHVNEDLLEDRVYFFSVQLLYLLNFYVFSLK